MMNLIRADWKKDSRILRSKVVPENVTPQVDYLLWGSIRLELRDGDSLKNAAPYERDGKWLIGRLGKIRDGMFLSRIEAKPKLPA